MSGKPVPGTRPLHGRVGLVTGSTSGIGWASASGLAEAGADVMLNGFWSVADGPARGLGLAERCGVRGAHSGADVALGAEVASRVADTEARFVTVEQIAALVLFLCSEQAASITGAALPVDGAWTAR